MAVKASVTITISKYRDTDSITRYYKLQASTAAAPAVPTTLTPSGWSTSEPTYTSGSTNTLYYTDCVVFSDGTFQYTDDGNGKAVKSSSYEAAKEAYNKAQAAQNTANTTQENLDNLQIGGRNYILNSAFIKGAIPRANNKPGWVFGTGSTLSTTILHNNHNSIHRYRTGTESIIWAEMQYYYFKDTSINIDGDEIWTLSFWLYVENGDWLNIENNKTIVHQFRVYDDSNTMIYSGNLTNFITSLQKSIGKWTKVVSTFTIPANKNNYKYFYLFNSPARDFDYYITDFKLERGNKSTDWTPAPEDTDEAIETVSAYAQNVANELLTAKGQLTAATTRIDSLQGVIENFVKDDNGMVTVTQTGSGMQIDMTQATNRINQLLTAIESAVTEGEANRLRSELLAAIQAVQSRTAYINATQDAQGRPVITLGATDSPFKVEITNEAINFIQNGQVIAYANGQKFYNLRTVVQQDVQIGIGPGFIWKTRDSGNMGLIWVPAQS